MYDLLGIGPAGGAIYSCNQALCYVPNKPTETGHLTAILTYDYSKVLTSILAPKTLVETKETLL